MATVSPHSAHSVSPSLRADSSHHGQGATCTNSPPKKIGGSEQRCHSAPRGSTLQGAALHCSTRRQISKRADSEKSGYSKVCLYAQSKPTRRARAARARARASGEHERLKPAQPPKRIASTGGSSQHLKPMRAQCSYSALSGSTLQGLALPRPVYTVNRRGEVCFPRVLPKWLAHSARQRYHCGLHSWHVSPLPADQSGLTSTTAGRCC